MTAPTAIIHNLPIAVIAAPSNVRLSNGHDTESLKQLANSIKTHGLMQPIIVRKAEDDNAETKVWLYTIVVGRRRLAACKLAGMEVIPAIVSETDEAKAYELEIAENIQREQMTLADTARAVRTLMMIYNSAKRVGSIVNKSPAWVSKHLTITSSQFPVTIAELLDRNIVTDLETLLLLRQIADMPASPEAMRTLMRMLRIAHEGNMNRQIARDALASLKTPDKPAAPVTTTTTTHTKPTHQAALEDEPTDPKQSFTVDIPIRYLEKLGSLGGVNWLIVQIDLAENA